MPCACCGKYFENGVCYHHIYSRKAYPEHAEKKWNMIPVCQAHHNEFHNKGASFVAKKYDSARKWLIKNGWHYSDFMQKWHHVENGTLQ
jgi:hypothetical protein